MPRTVTLVNEDNQPLGMADLMEAHTGKGLLHRAFSVYVFNPDRSRILIQQRSKEKMLWPLIWANTCCSHPFENEEAIAAGQRRLQEELGFSVPLLPKGVFVYRAEDPSGRGVEHEHVTILVGYAPDDLHVKPHRDEIAEWKWIELTALQVDMAKNPHRYAPWFHQGLDILLSTTR